MSSGALERLQAARDVVVRDPEILGGVPVIRGTRVPVYDIVASVAAGIPVERILSAYPSLHSENIELASLFGEAYPPSEISRESTSPSKGAMMVSNRRTRRTAC